MARVLLVVPPLPERSYPGKFMGLDYLATALLLKKHNVKIIDLDVFYTRKYDMLKEFSNTLKDFQPQLIGITNLSIQNDIVNYLAWFAKQKYPDSIIIKGGFHEITGYEFTLDLHHEYVDACVVGEGEIAITEIASAIDMNRWEQKKSEISSIAYWDGSKSVFNSKSRAEVDPNLLFPKRLNYYPEYNFTVLRNKKTAQMMTTRGCPYHCAFCSEAFFPSGFYKRDISSVIKELDYLKKKKYEAIYFDDSTFTLKSDRIVEIIKETHRRGFIWGCNTRVDVLNKELIKTMAQSGCVYLFCGVESLIPEVLTAMQKTKNPRYYLECVPRVYKWLREAGISPSVFLILGNAKTKSDGTIITENWSDVDYTIKSAIELDTDFISLNIVRLLPEVSFSTLPQYSCLRPTGNNPIHAGYYDSKWYMVNGYEDIRSKHPIYRCFEGCRSINSVFATPEYAYSIIEKAIHYVNSHNLNSGRQIKIVVDYKARTFFHEEEIGGLIQYSIDSFSSIPSSIEKSELLEDWSKIIKQD